MAIRNAFAFCAVALATTLCAHAQPYPSKPVRIIVPFAAGGPVDTVARTLAQKLTEELGQNFLVDNRAGGNAVIGSQAVQTSPPDGYTLLVNASIFLITPHLTKTPYNPLTDFSAIALIARGGLMMSVAPNVPVQNVRELIAYVRANPGKVNFAIGSLGSAGHLAQELFKRQAGIQFVTVPYRGSAPAYADLMAGHIQGFTDPAAGSMPQARAGKIRALAITSANRLRAMPELPTLAEQGFPGFEFYSWWGVWGPPAMPADLVARLNAAVNKVTQLPDMLERFAAQGVEPQQMSPAQFAKFQTDDSALSARIIRDSAIKLE
jgi:tripartite-type tricarboxylate transporter receptor subunit TctC